MGFSTKSTLLFIFLVQCALLVTTVTGCRCSNSTSELSVSNRRIPQRVLQQLGLSQQQAASMLSARTMPGTSSNGTEPASPPDSQTPNQPGGRGRRRWWGRRRNRNNQQQQNKDSQLPNQIAGQEVNTENLKKLEDQYGKS